MLDIPETKRRKIRAAVERLNSDLRWMVGDHPDVPPMLLRLAEESWRNGRAQGAERDL